MSCDALQVLPLAPIGSIKLQSVNKKTTHSSGQHPLFYTHTKDSNSKSWAASTGTEQRRGEEELPWEPGCTSREWAVYLFVHFFFVHTGKSEIVKTAVKSNQLVNSVCSWANIVLKYKRAFSLEKKKRSLCCGNACWCIPSPSVGVAHWKK